MSFSSRLQATALRLLSEYGQSISVVRDVIGAYAVSTGTVTDSADTTYTGYGYTEDYNAYLIDNTVIKQQDVKLTFYSTTQPEVNDIFTVDGQGYTALNVQRVTAQGVNVVYIVQLRQ